VKTKSVIVVVTNHEKSKCVLTGVDLEPYTSVEITHMLGKSVAWKYDTESMYLLQCTLFGESVCGYKTIDEFVEALQDAQDKLIEDWMIPPLSPPVYTAHYKPEGESKELIGFFTGNPVDIALAISSKPVGYCSVILEEIDVIQVQEQPIQDQLAYLKIDGKKTSQLYKEGYKITKAGDYVVIEKQE
jgi:hypothetical protein